MIGKKVLMKLSDAKWHLEHPEIYQVGERTDSVYETELQLHLMCALGEPVIGVIKAKSDNWFKTYLIEYKVGSLKTSYWLEKRDFTVI